VTVEAVEQEEEEEEEEVADKIVVEDMIETEEPLLMKIPPKQCSDLIVVNYLYLNRFLLRTFELVLEQLELQGFVELQIAAKKVLLEAEAAEAGVLVEQLELELEMLVAGPFAE